MILTLEIGYMSALSLFIHFPNMFLTKISSSIFRGKQNLRLFRTGTDCTVFFFHVMGSLEEDMLRYAKSRKLRSS